MAGLTCGTCKHFVVCGPQSPVIGDPKQGECREGPPSTTCIPVAGGAGAVAKFTSYPAINGAADACSRHALALATA
jgi:hypothetical protein